MLLEFFFSCKKTEPPLVEVIEQVNDIDGNVYKVKKIGSLYWTTENLKTTRYANGDVIPNLTDSTLWAEATVGAQVSYNNSLTQLQLYGRLYNALAVIDPRGLCPQGWRIPTNTDWVSLELHLGMTNLQADSMEYRGTNEGHLLKAPNKWPGEYTSGNKIGFEALPSGVRSYESVFDYAESIAVFWASSEAFKNHYWSRTISSNISQIGKFYMGETAGFSCRCVKDAQQ
ncbi:MAG: fibrobacter succinogenes major paralogous domain-containing protein [Flavobacteriales bacterium]